jgi:hypothetical protein
MIEKNKDIKVIFIIFTNNENNPKEKKYIGKRYMRLILNLISLKLIIKNNKHKIIQTFIVIAIFTPKIGEKTNKNNNAKKLSLLVFIAVSFLKL